MFIICVGLVIYFVYTIIVFTFLLGSDKNVLHKVFDIKVFVNAFVNLLYAVAVCFIPRKTKKMDFFNGVNMQNNP